MPLHHQTFVVNPESCCPPGMQPSKGFPKPLLFFTHYIGFLLLLQFSSKLLRWSTGRWSNPSPMRSSTSGHLAVSLLKGTCITHVNQDSSLIWLHCGGMSSVSVTIIHRHLFKLYLNNLYEQNKTKGLTGEKSLAQPFLHCSAANKHSW